VSSHEAIIPVQRPDRALLCHVIEGLLEETFDRDEIDAWHSLVASLDVSGPSIARVPLQPEDGGWIFITLGLLQKRGAYLGAPEEPFVRSSDLEAYRAELMRAVPEEGTSAFQLLRRHQVAAAVDTPLIVTHFPALHRLPALGIPLTRWAGDQPVLREQALFRWRGLIFEVTRSLDTEDLGRTVLSSTEAIPPAALATMFLELGMTIDQLDWFRGDYRLGGQPSVVMQRNQGGEDTEIARYDNTIAVHMKFFEVQREGVDCYLDRPDGPGAGSVPR